MNRAEKIWQPSPEKIKASNFFEFQNYLQLHHSLRFNSYHELHSWSLEESSKFWDILSNYLTIRWQKKVDPYYTPGEKGGMFGAKFFPHSCVNYAHNNLPDYSDEIVIESLDENSPIRKESGKSFHWKLHLCIQYLKQKNLKKGDRVAAICTNASESILAMMACASLGLVWSSVSPDFGVEAILDRFQQLEVKFIFLSPEYFYGGKHFPLDNSHQEILTKLNLSPEDALLLDHEYTTKTSQTSKLPSWQEKISKPAKNSVNSPDAPNLFFETTEFNHPLFILFSSGTTGKPKGIIHGHGGTLLQHQKELKLHSDLKSKDKLFFYTTCGWMMWNWMASSLGCGASLFLYDGSVSHPNLSTLWKVVDENKITHFGTSPKFLSLCALRRIVPQEKFNLSTLKCLLTTGAPLLAEQFDWIYQSVSKDIHLASISGGTDIISCFLLGHPGLPVYRGQIQVSGLGMSVEAWDEEAKPVKLAEKGELVCTKAFVSMPVGFLKDENNERYFQSYFSYFKEKIVWRHGDYIETTPEHGYIVHGRSDATLNPGGIRIGTSEIYAALCDMEELVDSVAASVKQKDGDSKFVLLVKLQEGFQLDESLKSRIKERIKNRLTPRHVPSQIFATKDLPYTRNGKKIEIAVTQILNQENIKNKDSIQNPECLEEIKSLLAFIKS